MRWERLAREEREEEFGNGNGNGPGKRWGHTCNAIKDGRFLYLFGGYGRLNCQTNQVFVFDTLTQKWHEPVINGARPAPRDSHTCTAVGDNLYVFGGTDGTSPLKDLHILDTSTHTWMHPNLRGEGPDAREGHSAALVGKRLFVFGGCGKSSSNDEVYYNDLYIFNTETFSWKRAITSGTPPSPRDSHTCSSWKKNLIVIGGEDGHDYYLSDVHILDTDTLVWRELNTSGYLLTPRAGHSTVAFGKKLFVFGGFTDAQNLYNDLFVLDLETAVWTKVATEGDGPSARFSVAGDCLDPQRRGVLVFFGGCNKSLEALDDMYYLYTGLNRESEQRLEKLSLKKQLKLKCQEQSTYNPIHSNALIGMGAGPHIHHRFSMQFCGAQNMSLMHPPPPPPQGKKTFHARVTERIADGYTIETTIDGKPLRGILFSNRQNYHHKVIPDSSRKRSAGEAGGVGTNGDNDSLNKSPRFLKQDNAVHGPEVKFFEDKGNDPQKEGSVVPILKDRAPSCSDTPQLVKVTANVESLAIPLSHQGNEQSSEATISDPTVPTKDSKLTKENGSSELRKENLSEPEHNTNIMPLDQGH